MINYLLTQRNKSEEEDLRPYILDDRRPEFHFRELSREYSVLPHGERESREDDERGEEVVWNKGCYAPSNMCPSTSALPPHDRAASCRNLAKTRGREDAAWRDF